LQDDISTSPEGGDVWMHICSLL